MRAGFAVVSVLLLIGSGIGATLIHMPTFASLWQTSYGQALLVKIGLLCAALLLAQVNLRSKIGSSNIIYIEYFYFVLYTAILGVAANALLFTLKGHGISQYRENLISKLLFWPYLLGACFGVTLVFLY